MRLALLIQRSAALDADIIEQRINEERRHGLIWSGNPRFPNVLIASLPQFPIGVPCCDYSRKLQSTAHPEMQCFFVTLEDWQRDTTFGEAPSGLESEHSDA